MWVSADFGGSTVDAILWARRGVGFEVENMKTWERENIFEMGKEDLGSMLRQLSPAGGLEKVFVSGGKSSFLPDRFEEIPLEKVSEIEAIGRGGDFLLRRDSNLHAWNDMRHILVVSMGTGTCMVRVERDGVRYLDAFHVGGTGVGGGTLLGLSKLLLQECDLEELRKLFDSGDSRKVDLSVQDIVGSGIGIVPPEATASNLARLAYSREYSRADLAAGIAHLVGQTLALQAIFAARSVGASVIVLTGKLTCFQKVVHTMLTIASRYGLPMVVPHQAPFVGAFGAFHAFFHASA